MIMVTSETFDIKTNIIHMNANSKIINNKNNQIKETSPYLKNPWGNDFPQKKSPQKTVL